MTTKTIATERRPDVAEHVETQHGEDGAAVLLFRVTASATPGRVTWDLAQVVPTKRTAEGFRSRRAARLTARRWLRGGAA